MVDDDEEMCEELSEILHDEGYAVRMAFDGLSGSRMIDKHDYNVILLDMKMPGLSGYEVLQRIKQTKPATKVIVLTGRPMASKDRMHEGLLIEDDDRHAQILRLADCVMNKPFDVPRVIEKIAEFTK
jgi:CheY-like chemotaxis protein